MVRTQEGQHDASGGGGDIMIHVGGYHKYIWGCSVHWRFNISQRLLYQFALSHESWCPWCTHVNPPMFWTPPVYWTSSNVLNGRYTGWNHSHFNAETKCKWAGHSIIPNICYRVIGRYLYFEKRTVVEINFFPSTCIYSWATRESIPGQWGNAIHSSQMPKNFW